MKLRLIPARPLLAGVIYNASGVGAVVLLCTGLCLAAALFGAGAARAGHVQARVD